jgi:hypothetical protein
MEILETSALSDIERAGQTLTTCRALGVRFALDDFGTGYSSLAYFRRLPIDVLKVDQSFVRDMLDDPDDMEIVESVVRLAHAFNRLVVAEGVETPEHGALLTLLGCRLGQGFGIARPMPADAVPAWVSTWPEQGEGMVVDQGISKDDIPLMMAMQNHRRGSMNSSTRSTTRTSRDWPRSREHPAVSSAGTKAADQPATEPRRVSDGRPESRQGA